MRIKVCGMTRPEQVYELDDMGVDFALRRHQFPRRAGRERALAMHAEPVLPHELRISQRRP